MNVRKIEVGAVLLMLSVQAMAGQLVVEPGGLSPAEAVDAVRADRRAGDNSRREIIVKGVNRIAETLLLTEEDHDIDFTGEDGAVISGGVEIRGWSDIGGGVWEAPAPKLGDGRTMFFDQLWTGGRRLSCARLPNEGWLRIITASQTVARVDNVVTTYTDRVFTDAEELKQLAAIPAEDLPYLEVGIVCNWCYSLRSLGGVDVATGSFATETESVERPWRRMGRSTTQIAFFNVRNAFDEPGEWFLDMKAGKVRYRPRPGETLEGFSCVAPRSGLLRLVHIRGDWTNARRARNIRFHNISFMHTSTVGGDNRPHPLNMFQAAADMTGAIATEGVEGLVFENCRISGTSGYAMRFNSASVSNRIVSCTLEDIGAGGIWMGAKYAVKPKKGEIPRRVLEVERKDAVAFNLISNCTIRSFGRYNPEGTGVALTHCSDTKVVKCDIFDGYYTGVSVGFTWGFAGSVAQRNEIAFNRIWDLGKGVMSDMGGVYTLGTSFGTTVHDNVIHDVWSFYYGGWGLYCDEGSEGIVMERNLVWNTTDGGFHQHYGTGCTIRNNIFAYNRKIGAVRMKRDVVQGIPCTLDFVNNIVLVKGGDSPLCGEGVHHVGGVWAGNLWWNEDGAGKYNGMDWKGWKASGKEIGGMEADPKFADARRYDFRLQEDSPAFDLGFKAWDYSKAGSDISR